MAAPPSPYPAQALLVWDGTQWQAATAPTTTPASDAPGLVVRPVGGLTATTTPHQATPTDRSGTITTGGVAQVLAAANASRVYLFVQNTSTGTLSLSFTGTASLTTLQLAPGASYENPPHFCPVGAISIFGATTAQAFVAMEA
ncbi:MAG: hypothetical protein WCG26_09975 [Chloroflexales bacterium]